MTMLETTRHLCAFANWLFAILLLASCQPLSCGLSLNSTTPMNSPVSGGTQLLVTGQGFVSGFSTCQILHTSYGAINSDENIIHNSSFMTCIMPNADFIPLNILTPTAVVQLRILNPPDQSNTVDLTLFNLAQMTVNSIDPTQGFNSSTITISIHGTSFVNTGEITCNINDLIMAADYVNSTQLRCLLPIYPMPSQVMVDILLNGQKVSRVLPSSSNSTLFTFFSTPPDITCCRFTASYSQLLLCFDREVEVGGEEHPVVAVPINCNIIFAPDSLTRVGVDASCQWHNLQQRRVVIHLSPSSLVLPSSLLTFNNSTIRTRSVAFSKLVSGTVVVQSSSHLLQPMAVITGPQYIPYCGNLTLSARESRNAGPRPLLFRWNITADLSELYGSGGNPLISTQLEPLPENFTSLETVSFPSDSFQEGVIYTVAVTVQNFLGLEHSSEVILSKLTAPAPSVWIVGSREVTTTVDREVLIEGVARIPGCLDEGVQLSFQWCLHSHQHTQLIPTQRSPILLIPPRTLLHNAVYTASLVVTANGVHTSNTSVLISTQRQPLVARIAGGNTVTYEGQEPILLDGTVSVGLTQDVQNDETFSTTWECRHLPVAQSSCNTSGQLEKNGLHLKLHPNALSSGNYLFILTLTYNGTVSTANQTAVILPHSAPRVSISVPKRLIPTHRKLILHGTVSSSLPATSSWSTVYLPGELDNENNYENR